MPRRGWLVRRRWLLLRRLAQLGLLAAFLAGPWFGVWILSGDLASSVLFDTLPLTDPLVLLQALVAGHGAQWAALSGGALVLLAYAVLGGRSYCAWVCPLSLVTDLAAGLRRWIGLGRGWQMRRQTRRLVLAAVLVASAASGTLVWEWINPITVLQRGILFGMGAGWALILAVFVFDLAVSAHGWCGHLCPVGAFYGLIGRVARVRVNAAARTHCTDCGDCFRICPEPQVIAPALKPAIPDASPVILDGDCLNCGRCLDVCEEDVFTFGTRHATVSLRGPGNDHHARDTLRSPLLDQGPPGHDR